MPQAGTPELSGKRPLLTLVARLARRRSVQLGVFVEAPAIFLGTLVYWAIEGGNHMQDFGWMRRGALAVLHGRPLYPRPDPALLVLNDKFIYPPLDAFALVPVAVLPRAVSYVVFLLLCAGAEALALWLLRVRDWRCYGVAVLAPPSFFSFGVGALGPLLLLGAAAAWRFRNRTAFLAPVVGVTVLAKLFLWPLIVWLAATRRWGAAAGAAATAVGLALASWAGIGFDGFSDYPTLLRVLDRVQIPKSYSVGGLAWDLGLSNEVGTAALAVVAGAGCVTMAYVARRPDGDAAAFIVAIFTSLLATPLLWGHYLILLLAPLALTQRRLSWVWAVPLAFWATPGLGATPGRVWEPVFLLALTLAIGGRLLALGTREPAAARTV